MKALLWKSWTVAVLTLGSVNFVREVEFVTKVQQQSHPLLEFGCRKGKNVGFEEIEWKKTSQMIRSIKKYITFALANKQWGLVAQLNRVADYGSAGSGFESLRGHSARGEEDVESSSFFVVNSYLATDSCCLSCLMSCKRVCISEITEGCLLATLCSSWISRLTR